MPDKLSFGIGNAKLSRDVLTFSIPAGYTCPGAQQCLALADRHTGKLTDGKHQRFRCFSASQEAVYPNVRKARWHNYELLKLAGTQAGMAELILRSLPSKGDKVRVHVSGDFFSEAYLRAWYDVARFNTGRLFYAYTKSIPFVKAAKSEQPDNFKLVASLGGKFDEQSEGMAHAKVVLSEEEADVFGLTIDHDDSHAMSAAEDFALLIHGAQPSGSKASFALRELRAAGVQFSYGRKAA